ncbi:cytochrome P450 [Gonapodya prolifera JEL478]|uniref:Cytochrome P450 n=1 Tax=Gonapodya prolifera (strain JEL478) TaxID=1344416 RepID=A0A139ASF0_GONPJ|nr:cytochrome P450 [Gonapodya prolifera JEL478]|eukprot:KXS19473.1 cytochrome P450 [Gonapodya prolifera JEL478]
MAALFESLLALPWPVTAILAALFFVATLILLYPDRAYGTRSRSDIPLAQENKPLIGAMAAMAQGIDFRLERLLEQVRRQGEGKPYRMTLYNPMFGPMDMIVISDVQDVETVLRDPYTFVKGGLLTSLLTDFLGQGIFTSDGERWHAQRKTASHVFNVKNFRNFNGDFLHEVGYLIKHLEAARDAGAVVDLQDLLLRCTLDSFGRLAMGSDFGCITQPGSVKEGRYALPTVEFMEAFDYVNGTVAVRAMQPFWQLQERLNGTTNKIKACQKIMSEFADKVITDKRRKMEKGETIGEDGKSTDGRHADMLDYFMRTTNFDGGVPDDHELRDVCMNLIIAGRDTTAQTLTWVFYMLSSHPEVEAKCREEINRVFGKDGQPTYEKIKELKYLTATFNETLRLHANVPFNTPTCTKQTTLAGTGTTVYPGDIIQYSPWVMGRLQSIWGPDAEEFRPERWLDDGGSVKKENTFKWPVFKAGPRICLGMNMATQEAVTFMAQILRTYRLELVNEDDPSKWGKYDVDPAKRQGRYSSALTLGLKGTVDFKVHLVQ